MTAHQEALFATPEESERERVEAYLRSLTACPFCGKDESGPWMYVNNHGYMGGWPRYADGSGCARLHLLGNQARGYAARGDVGTAADRWVEVTRYQKHATQWPAEWFAALEDELRDAGVLA